MRSAAATLVGSSARTCTATEVGSASMAMISRGYDGGMPPGLLTVPATRVEWLGVAGLVTVAASITVASRLVVG